MSNDQTTHADGGSGGGSETGYVADEQLPTDLVPGEDNPLAGGAEEGESAIDPEIEPGGARERPYEKRPDQPLTEHASDD